MYGDLKDLAITRRESSEARNHAIWAVFFPGFGRGFGTHPAGGSWQSGGAAVASRQDERRLVPAPANPFPILPIGPLHSARPHR